MVGDVWLSNRVSLQIGYSNIITQTDTQIVAHLWERWGVECLRQIEGMFALVVWDRHKQQLWL